MDAENEPSTPQGELDRTRSSLEELARRLDAARKARADDIPLPVPGSTISGLSDCSVLGEVVVDLGAMRLISLSGRGGSRNENLRAPISM